MYQMEQGWLVQLSFFLIFLVLQQQQVQVGREDVDAIEDKTNIAARETVLSFLQLEHPIVVDQFNLCHMIISDQLVTLKLGLLQFQCKSLSSWCQHHQSEEKRLISHFCKIF